MNQMRNHLLLSIVVVMSFSSRWLHADVYKEPRSGVEFPQAIGLFKRGNAKPYSAEAGKAGVALPYRSNDAELTLYFRDVTGNPPQTTAAFLQDSLAAIKELETRGQYSNVKI